MKKAGIRATQCHHMTVMKQLSETQNPVIHEMVHPQVIEQLQETIKQNKMNVKKSEEECVFDKPIQCPVQPIESITCIPSVVQQECVGAKTDGSHGSHGSHPWSPSLEQRQALLLLLLSVFCHNMNGNI